MAWPDPYFHPGQAPCLAPFSSGSGAKDAGSLVSTALGAMEPMDLPKNWSHHLAVVLLRSSEPQGVTVPDELTSLPSSTRASRDWAHSLPCFGGRDMAPKSTLPPQASPSSLAPGQTEAPLLWRYCSPAPLPCSQSPLPGSLC